VIVTFSLGVLQAEVVEFVPELPDVSSSPIPFLLDVISGKMILLVY